MALIKTYHQIIKYCIFRNDNGLRILVAIIYFFSDEKTKLRLSNGLKIIADKNRLKYMALIMRLQELAFVFRSKMVKRMSNYIKKFNESGKLAFSSQNVGVFM